jgi:hypothetical protein
MKHVLILVFPMLWSPKNTSLYCASGAKDAAVGRARPDTTEERDITENEEDVAAMGREAGLVFAVAVLKLILPVLPLADAVVLVAPVGAEDASPVLISCSIVNSSAVCCSMRLTSIFFKKILRGLHLCVL